MDKLQGRRGGEGGLDWEQGQSIVTGGKAGGQHGGRRGEVLEYKEGKGPWVFQDVRGKKDEGSMVASWATQVARARGWL